jgi:peptide/nickel transport system substrate-binding protein
MTVVSRRQILVFFLVVSLVAMFYQPASARSFPPATDAYEGPYLDEIQLNWFSGEETIDALLNNEIDLITNPISTETAAALEQAEDIKIVSHLQNGYGSMIINCEKYPFNITAFRRALAFAVDKERVAADVWNGWAEPLDSLIPRNNPFSVEGNLNYSYYDANVEQAEMLLDMAGFLDVDEDGFREAPDGSHLHVLLEVPDSSSTLIEAGEILEEGLDAIHINATSRPTDFYEYLSRYYFCGYFDLIFLSSTFGSLDVSWLAYEYWVEYVESPCELPRWSNETFDSWREQLLYSLDYEEVYEAAIKMQEIWVYESPEIVLYQRILPYSHRTDRFSGFVDEPLDSIGGW